MATKAEWEELNARVAALEARAQDPWHTHPSSVPDQYSPRYLSYAEVVRMAADWFGPLRKMWDAYESAIVARKVRKQRLRVAGFVFLCALAVVGGICLLARVFG